MKIFCFYGVGVSTERSYYYAVADEELEETCEHDAGCTHDDTSEHQSACSSSTSSSRQRVPEMVNISFYMQYKS